MSFGRLSSFSATFVFAAFGVSSFELISSKEQNFHDNMNFIERHLAYASPLENIASGSCSPTKESDWTYNFACTEEKDYQVAPDMWHKKYPDCDGTRQSPINLSIDIISRNCPKYKIQFFPGNCAYGSLTYEPTIRSWRVGFEEKACDEPPYLIVNDVTYNLLEIHSHSVAEHSVGGGFSDAELHFVHSNSKDDKDLVVIAVFMDVNYNYLGNTELDNYWYRIAGEASKISGITFTTKENLLAPDAEIVNPYSLLPADWTFYNYLGSLTTPPCSETVTWVVMRESVYISPIQLELFRSVLRQTPGSLADKNGNNARPMQDLNERDVYRCTI